MYERLTRTVPLQFVEGLSPSEMQSLLFCKVLARKPGWKDSNFQVMNAKFAVVATLVEKAKVFGKKSTTCVLSALVDKFADMKVQRKQCSTDMIVICAGQSEIRRNFDDSVVEKEAQLWHYSGEL